MPPSLALLLPLAAGPSAVVDRNGVVSGLFAAGDLHALTATWRVPARGWDRLFAPGEAREVETGRDGAAQTWRGLVGEGANQYRFDQRLTDAGGVVTIALNITAVAGGDSEGVFFWLDLPLADYAGGTATLVAAGEPSAVMPVEQPERRHFLSGEAAGARLASADGARRLEVGFSRAIPVTIQDTREWQGTTYTLFARFGESLATGESASLTVTLTPGGVPDTSPARLTIDPANERYRLGGIGGNYCFNIESPVTQYTLANLRQNWVRVELTGNEWEPENDNDDPTDLDLAKLAANDTEGSNLRREFLLARQIQDLGYPYVASTWLMPEWIYTDPGRGPQAHGRVIAREMWPEMLELVGGYLLYAKQQYGVEPDLFSFNEPDWGVRVKFTPEEHRDAINAFGAWFEAHGLKTRLLLGDVTNARDTHRYCLPALEDPAARRYIGAIAFHSWGGGTREQYEAWADLAEAHELPLLVAELGVDAGAWRGRTYDSFAYALREMWHYQEILLWARPTATMQWEFTSDYGTCQVIDGEVVPTVRYHLVRQFCNLTPRGAVAVGSESDHAKVLVTAFTLGDEWTIHMVNSAAAREATLTGLPPNLTHLRAVRTSAEEGFAELGEVAVEGGRVTLELAAQSLTTLTTVEGG